MKRHARLYLLGSCLSVLGVVAATGAGQGPDPQAYREQARSERGIERPEVLMPVTAHPALDKAFHYFDMTPVRVPVDGDFRVDVDFARDHIGPATVAIVASAGTYPHGVVDPIPELGRLALEHGLGLHVDGCLGGFILPWADELGYPVTPFDLSVTHPTRQQFSNLLLGQPTAAIVFYWQKQMSTGRGTPPLVKSPEDVVSVVGSTDTVRRKLKTLRGKGLTRFAESFGTCSLNKLRRLLLSKRLKNWRHDGLQKIVYW